MERTLFLGRHGAAQLDKLQIFAGHGVAQPVSPNPEVVPNRAVKGDLLERRGTEVARRGGQTQFGRAVLQNLDYKLGGRLVSPSVGIDKLQFIALAGGKRELLEHGHGAVGSGGQSERVALFAFGDEPGRGNRLVELHRQVQTRALHRAEPAGVFHTLGRLPGVGGEGDLRIGALQARILEYANREVAGASGAVFHVINEVGRHLGNGAAEKGVGQALDQRDTPGGPSGRANDQVDIGRQSPAKTRHHHQALAALELCVPR